MIKALAKSTAFSNLLSCLLFAPLAFAQNPLPLAEHSTTPSTTPQQAEKKMEPASKSSPIRSDASRALSPLTPPSPPENLADQNPVTIRDHVKPSSTATKESDGSIHYFDDSKRLKSIAYPNGSQMIRTYSDAGYLNSQYNVDANGNITFEEFFDSSKRIIRTRYFNDRQKIAGGNRFFYDPSTQLIRQIDTFGANDVLTRTTYYDDAGYYIVKIDGFDSSAQTPSYTEHYSYGALLRTDFFKPNGTYTFNWSENTAQFISSDQTLRKNWTDLRQSTDELFDGREPILYHFRGRPVITAQTSEAIFSRLLNHLKQEFPNIRSDWFQLSQIRPLTDQENDALAQSGVHEPPLALIEVGLLGFHEDTHTVKLRYYYHVSHGGEEKISSLTPDLATVHVDIARQAFAQAASLPNSLRKTDLLALAESSFNEAVRYAGMPGNEFLTPQIIYLILNHRLLSTIDDIARFHSLETQNQDTLLDLALKEFGAYQGIDQNLYLRFLCLLYEQGKLRGDQRMRIYKKLSYTLQLLIQDYQPNPLSSDQSDLHVILDIAKSIDSKHLVRPLIEPEFKRFEGNAVFPTETDEQFKKRKSLVYALWEKHGVLVLDHYDYFGRDGTRLELFSAFLKIAGPAFTQALDLVWLPPQGHPDWGTGEGMTATAGVDGIVVFNPGSYLSDLPNRNEIFTDAMMHEMGHVFHTSSYTVTPAIDLALIRLNEIYKASSSENDLVDPHHTHRPKNDYHEEMAEMVRHWFLDNPSFFSRAISLAKQGNTLVLEKYLLLAHIFASKSSDGKTVPVYQAQFSSLPADPETAFRAQGPMVIESWTDNGTIQSISDGQNLYTFTYQGDRLASVMTEPKSMGGEYGSFIDGQGNQVHEIYDQGKLIQRIFVDPSGKKFRSDFFSSVDTALLSSRFWTDEGELMVDWKKKTATLARGQRVTVWKEVRLQTPGTLRNFPLTGTLVSDTLTEDNGKTILSFASNGQLQQRLTFEQGRKVREDIFDPQTGENTSSSFFTTRGELTVNRKESTAEWLEGSQITRWKEVREGSAPGNMGLFNFSGTFVHRLYLSYVDGSKTYFNELGQKYRQEFFPSTTIREAMIYDPKTGTLLEHHRYTDGVVTEKFFYDSYGLKIKAEIYDRLTGQLLKREVFDTSIDPSSPS